MRPARPAPGRRADRAQAPSGAAPASGAWSSSTSTSAIANAARNGSDHSAMVRHQPGARLAAPPGAREGIDRGDQRRQEQRPGEHREHPAGQHLAADREVRLRPVLRRLRCAVERADESQRRPAELAEPVPARRPRARARPQAAAARRCPISGSPRARRRAAAPARRARVDSRAARAGRARPPRRAPPRTPRGSKPPPCGSSPMLPRRSSFDQAIRTGPRAEPAPRFDSAITASIRSRSSAVRANRRAPASPSVLPSTDAKHERLPRRPALDHARELEQRGGVGGAPGRVGDGLRVARSHDHDLVAALAGPARDHVHERLAVLVPRVDRRLEPLRLELRGSAPPGRARPPRSTARPDAGRGAAPRSGASRGTRRRRRTARRRRAPGAPASAGSRARTSRARRPARRG